MFSQDNLTDFLKKYDAHLYSCTTVAKEMPGFVLTASQESSSTITCANESANGQQNRQLQTLLAITCLLLMASLILCLFLYKRAMALRLSQCRQNSTMKHLEDTNKQLGILNQNLSEANRVKEEYIGCFLDLCSENIGRLENYRKMIRNRLATKKYDELMRIVSTDSNTAESRDMYSYFDKAFLKIYPGFIPALNEQLKCNKRFDIGKSEILNTELRIFALIRIGITDSAKIATFLRCSIQTVYNYRCMIKRKCLDGQMDIEAFIKQIGIKGIF